MHINQVLLVGRVGKNLPKLQYASSGVPTCAFTLEIDEIAKSGEVFTLYLPVEIWGQAERAAVRAQVMALTGRLDEGERPRRATPSPSSGDFIEVSPPTSPYEERLALGYTYAGVEKLLRKAGIRNSALDELRRHHDAQAGR